MATTNNPFEKPTTSQSQRDDWEDWEDDDSDTTVNKGDLLLDLSDVAAEKSNKSATPHRFSVQKPMRIKSKGRQKARI